MKKSFGFNIPMGEDAYTIDGSLLIDISQEIAAVLKREENRGIGDYDVIISTSEDNSALMVVLCGKEEVDVCTDYYIIIDVPTAEIIGIMKINRTDKDNEDTLIEKAYVREEYRREGVFTELLNMASSISCTCAEHRRITTDPEKSMRIISDEAHDSISTEEQKHINEQIADKFNLIKE